MHHGSLPSVKSESKRTQMMVLQTASGTCHQKFFQSSIALDESVTPDLHSKHCTKRMWFQEMPSGTKNGSFPLAVDCICRSARIRTFSMFVEYQRRHKN